MRDNTAGKFITYGRGRSVIHEKGALPDKLWCPYYGSSRMLLWSLLLGLVETIKKMMIAWLIKCLWIPSSHTKVAFSGKDPKFCLQLRKLSESLKDARVKLC